MAGTQGSCYGSADIRQRPAQRGLPCCTRGITIPVFDLGGLPLQILLNVIITVKLGQMNEDACGTAAVTPPTVTAVADASAGRTDPILGEQRQHKRPRPSSMAPSRRGSDQAWLQSLGDSPHPTPGMCIPVSFPLACSRKADHPNHSGRNTETDWF